MLSSRDCSPRPPPPEVANPEPPPDDMLFDIFLRLPAKTLVLCKLVCRSWRSMIDDPLFISKHLKQSAFRCSAAHTHLAWHWGKKGNRKLVISSVRGRGSVRQRTPGKIPRDADQHNWNDKIVGSHNGIVCLRRYWREKGPSARAKAGQHPPLRWRAYLWNPATREYRVLPEGSIHSNSTPVVYGFGYVSTTDNYLVVRFTVNFDPTHRTCAEVFSLTDGSWREVESAPNDRIGLWRESSTWHHLQKYDCDYAQLDGILYWVSLVGHEGEQMLSFDLGSEEFGLSDLPSFGADGYMFRKLTVHENALYFIIPRGVLGDCFDLWVMDPLRGNGRVDGDWTRLITIGPFIEDTRPLGFGINGEVFMERVNNAEVIMYVYEPSTERVWVRVRGRCLYSRPSKRRLPLDFHFYTESLVWLSPKESRTFL